MGLTDAITDLSPEPVRPASSRRWRCHPRAALGAQAGTFGAQASARKLELSRVARGAYGESIELLLGKAIHLLALLRA